jgi:fumarate hydratase subunit alpha
LRAGIGFAQTAAVRNDFSAVQKGENMRELDVRKIESAVKDLCMQSNIRLPASLEECIKKAAQNEHEPIAKSIFDDMQKNLEVAKQKNIPICQDTGTAVIFIRIGQDVHFTGGSLTQAINSGVAKGYTEGYLRCSMVADPIRRENTGDNTPPIVHCSICDGDAVEITVAPKGFGSENKSALKMFNPADTQSDIADFVVETVERAGGAACPPLVVGVGIGGNFEYCAFLAKKALCRDVSLRNPDRLYADFEDELLRRINMLGIGPQGFGGDITALAVNVEYFPTHIAGLPVAVNIGCHVTRELSVKI